MSYTANTDLAMILPLPAATPASEQTLHFISLKGYASFFDDMASGFPRESARSVGVPREGGYPGGGNPLAIHEVGDFVASFVPTLGDFARLDRRFRLPQQTWQQIPAYADYGFAVFKLRARSKATIVHPMAFEFKTRTPNILFLPTVHIHDGIVHPSERFDHTLYVQDYRLRPTYPNDSRVVQRGEGAAGTLWPSTRVARGFMDITRTQGIINPSEICLKWAMRGDLPNRDTLILCG
jgi:hypothetical protein